MQRNRQLARILDAVILAGLALYVAAVIVTAQRELKLSIQPLLVWCAAVWAGPSLARRLIIPPARPNGAPPPANRYFAYSDARDRARPPLWMLALRWLVVPAALGGALYYLNGRVDLLSCMVQALIVVVFFAAFFRGTIEIVSLIATVIFPAKASAVRQRAERAWSLVYFVGLPLLLVSRYHT